MRTVCVRLCCLSFVALGSARELATERYTVILLPDHQYSAVALQEMGREASTVLMRSGIALRLHIGHSTEVFDGTLVVVNLRGRCDMNEGPPAVQGGPLGWTHSENGSLLPFAELACEPIRGSVQSALPGRDAARGNTMLGRAMGRVLAHELYHIAGETFKHGRDGVAQAMLSPQDLISNRLELDPEDVETIRGKSASLEAGSR
jgi:hypothetical protein